MRRYFDRAAAELGRRATRDSAEYLAPLAAALLRVKPDPERALDIGTGTGDRRAADRPGVPPCPRARRRHLRGDDPPGPGADRPGSRGAGGLPGRRRLLASPTRTTSFDLVAQLNMPPFFGEIARVLRPGGYVGDRGELGSRRRPSTRPSPSCGAASSARPGDRSRAATAGAGTYFVARTQPAMSSERPPRS